MVSQFEVSDQYNQINYNGRPVRVTLLEYGDLIKWFTNRSNGIPAYLVIDMVTQNVDVVRLPEGEGIHYSTSEHFGRYLMRHLRFQYPTFMFDTPVFEINEEGEPYWICPKLEKPSVYSAALISMALCWSTPSPVKASITRKFPLGLTVCIPLN